LNKKRVRQYSLIIIISSIILFPQISFSEEIIPDFISFTVYSDGYVFVDYSLIVNQTFPSQNITVIGQVLEDLIVTNEEGLPLDYSKNGTSINVYSLDSTEIRLTYLTQDITSKDGRFWTLSISSSINTQIVLPLDAIIMSLNKVPEIIEIRNNKVTLLMSSGPIEVTYVIGVIGNQEYTQIVINETEELVTEIINSEVIIPEAEIKLEQAKNAFSLGNFAEAEILANEAKNLAILTNQTSGEALSKIIEAQSAISTAENEGRFFGLDNSKYLIEEANTFYTDGKYPEALNSANNALTQAEKSTYSQDEGSNSLPVIEILIVILVLVSITILIVFIKSRKKAIISPKKKRRINVDRIFKENKNLIFEEKQAIQFLIDNGGQAFEADLYDHIRMPRTTTWRMVRRLRNMGIITVTKFRRQNLVRIKTKYDYKE
jgi:uncharacterized membrane protein